MERTEFTLKERRLLLKLRKQPRTWDYLKKMSDVDDDGMNIMLSRMGDLFYVEEDKPICEGKIVLNQIGETVAQAEYDYRFDLYFNRAISLSALIVSVIAIIVSIFF